MLIKPSIKCSHRIEAKSGSGNSRLEISSPLLVGHRDPRRSDCIRALPRRFVMRFAHELDLTPPPLDLPPARIVALWQPRTQEDGGHAWLRDRLYQAADAT